MEKEGNIYNVKTEMDLQLSVQESRPYLIKGKKHRELLDAEIVFRVYGYDSSTDEDYDIVTSISKDEARNLATALLNISNN